jgi:hypothetical protein
MKKTYNKPTFEVTEFRFSEHIAASPGCIWGSGATWTHAFEGCATTYHPGTPGWSGLNG